MGIVLFGMVGNWFLGGIFPPHTSQKPLRRKGSPKFLNVYHCHLCMSETEVVFRGHRSPLYSSSTVLRGIDSFVNTVDHSVGDPAAIGTLWKHSSNALGTLLINGWALEDYA